MAKEIESGKVGNMKRASRQLIVIVLIIALAVLAVGCGGIKPAFLDEKVTEMVDLYVSQDTDSAFSLIYPGLIDRESYQSGAEAIYEYFPVKSGYTMKREDFKYGKGLSSGKDIAEGRYTVEFDETVYYVIVQWCSDTDGSGFTTFRIFNENDWAKAQEKEED